MLKFSLFPSFVLPSLLLSCACSQAYHCDWACSIPSLDFAVPPPAAPGCAIPQRQGLQCLAYLKQSGYALKTKMCINMQMNYTSICIWSWTIMTPMHARSHTHTHTHTRICTWIVHAHIHTHEHMHAHTNTRTQIHTNPQTHTNARTHLQHAPTQTYRHTSMRLTRIRASRFQMQLHTLPRTATPCSETHPDMLCAYSAPRYTAMPVHGQIRTHHTNQGTCWRPLSIRETTKVCFRLHHGSVRRLFLSKNFSPVAGDMKNTKFVP